MENFPTEILMTIITAAIAAISFLGKRYLNKQDEKQKKKEEEREEEQKRIFEERNQQRQEIRDNVKRLEAKVDSLNTHLRRVTTIVLKCENPECNVKKELAAYWEKQED